MRSEIRRAILSGDIDQALEVTHSQFPTVLAENPAIVFRLKCQKWVELISKTTELGSKQSTAEDREAEKDSNKDREGGDDFTQDMELDEQSGSLPRSDQPENPQASKDVFEYDRLINEAMLYGQELQREYRDQEGDYAKTLQDIFSLVAYDDPKQSIHGHLLDPSSRVNVGEELNSAILGEYQSTVLCETY
jgi:hypothetical protein